MQIAVLCSPGQKDEFIVTGISDGHPVVWTHTLDELATCISADAIIDLLFEQEPDHLGALKNFLPRTVIVNSVTATLQETDPAFVRMNGWTTFLSSYIVEASAATERRQVAETALAVFKKEIVWLPDTTGFISPRVISMIIHEAYAALADGVSSKEDIDTAMRTGTNYPYGPFEWAEKIGLPPVQSLLKHLGYSLPA